MEKALEDIRVIDLGRVIAMPYCTMLLADLGAEVIKVLDPAQADMERRAMKDTFAGFLMFVNRNKKSITLDLKDPKGVEIFKELVKRADLVVQNFSVGTMDKLGIGYDALKEVNPKIIYASVSAFGQDGPDAYQRGYDILAQARSGYVSLTGPPDGPPMRSGQSISDYYAGMLCAYSIVSAIHYRERTGKGQQIDIALLDSLVTTLDGAPELYTIGEEIRPRRGNMYGGYGIFEVQDGYIALAVTGTDLIWPRFCRAIGRPELIKDPKFSEMLTRWNNSDDVQTIVEAWAKTKTRKEALELLTQAGVPVALVNTIDEMVADPQMQARRMHVEVEHPEYGRVKITGSPLKLSETPGKVERAAAIPGEHTEAVLTDILGYTPEEIERLRTAGVI